MVLALAGCGGEPAMTAAAERACARMSNEDKAFVRLAPDESLYLVAAGQNLTRETAQAVVDAIVAGDC